MWNDPERLPEGYIDFDNCMMAGPNSRSNGRMRQDAEGRTRYRHGERYEFGGQERCGVVHHGREGLRLSAKRGKIAGRQDDLGRMLEDQQMQKDICEGRVCL